MAIFQKESSNCWKNDLEIFGVKRANVTPFDNTIIESFHPYLPWNMVENAVCKYYDKCAVCSESLPFVVFWIGIQQNVCRSFLCFVPNLRLWIEINVQREKKNQKKREKRMTMTKTKNVAHFGYNFCSMLNYMQFTRYTKNANMNCVCQYDSSLKNNEPVVNEYSTHSRAQSGVWVWAATGDGELARSFRFCYITKFYTYCIFR